MYNNTNPTWRGSNWYDTVAQIEKEELDDKDELVLDINDTTLMPHDYFISSKYAQHGNRCVRKGKHKNVKSSFDLAPVITLQSCLQKEFMKYF